MVGSFGRSVSALVYLLVLTGLFSVFFSISESMAIEVGLTWDRNREADVTGYRLYYGGSTGSYSVVRDVGNAVTATVDGLSESGRYYFAVTAYNSLGMESGYSSEVSFEPSLDCTYAISPGSTDFGVSGGAGSVHVTATQGCTWSALAGAPWITITGNLTGTGNGVIGFAVSANTSSQRRSAVSDFATNSFTVNQSGSLSSGTVAITASAGLGGSIVPEGVVHVPGGGEETFYMIPNEGYAVDGVTVDGSSVGPVEAYTFSNVDKDHTISVSFRNALYTLCIGREGAGSGLVKTVNVPGISCGSVCEAKYSNGTSVTLTAEAAVGSVFAGWQGDDCSGVGPCNLLMKRDRRVRAMFEPQTYIVTPVAGVNGSIAPATPQNVRHGGSATFTVAPHPGYAVEAVTGCGGSLAAAKYTTSPVSGSCSVTASFRPADRCYYNLGVAGKAFGAQGFGLVSTVSVRGTGADACGAPSVDVVEGSEWIQASLSGWNQGSWNRNRGSVRVTVVPSTQSSVRTGTVTIGDTVFTATQAGAPCSVTALSPTIKTFPKTGGDQTFTVTTSTTDCSWSASTTQSSWIHITSGSGTGNGSVTFFVDTYTGTMTRSGSVVVQPTSGGTFSSKKTFTVKQTK